MASRQTMNMNKHIRSRAGQPVETASRMKRNRRRAYGKQAQRAVNKEA